MSELLTAAQMRAIEMAAIESGEVTGLELMERAGRGVVEAIFEEWPELAGEHHGLTAGEAVDWGPTPQLMETLDTEMRPLRAVVLCGPGNNGGDGFVVARLLKEQGWSVEVFLYGDAEKLAPDAKANYVRWREMGEVRALTKDALAAVPEPPAILLDAVFGTGLVRPIGHELGSRFKELRNAIHHRNDSSTRVVAVDATSGLCMDSGEVLGASPDNLTAWRPLSAHITVSFHKEKLGHRLSEGPGISGKTVVKSIGLEALSSSREATNDLAAKIVLKAQPSRLAKTSASHKYSHGHALILSGGAGKSGAARLAARGALRIGAGLVTLGVPHEAQGEVAAQITALMMREIGDAGALAKTLEDPRLNALCLGPGLGLERARALVPVAVRAEHTPYVVLDADALSAFADAPDALFEMLHENCVLTPHEGEFKRLFPDIHAKLAEVPTKGPAYSKVDATREAAKRAGCVVLFKGPDTVIADPTGRCSINSAHYERSAPWLATAGSGDVLAGFITGLLARGLAPMMAAETAAWLQVECALAFGPGLIAEDLPEQLPAVFRKLDL